MLTIYNPRNVFESLFVDDFFDRSWYNNTPSARGRLTTRTAGIIQTDKDTGAKVYTLEIPGYDKQDVKVTYNNDILSVSGAVKDSDGNVTKNFNVNVSFASVDKASIKAELKNGILTVRGDKEKEEEGYVIAVE